MPKGRPFGFPDPKDRSVNRPHALVERPVVIALFNRYNEENEHVKMCKAVKDWFVAEARRQGWKSVKFVDGAAVLTALVKLG